jgi:hypothetical protein
VHVQHVMLYSAMMQIDKIKTFSYGDLFVTAQQQAAQLPRMQHRRCIAMHNTHASVELYCARPCHTN